MEKRNIKTKIELQRWPEANQDVVEETKPSEPSERKLPDLVRNALDAFEVRLKDQTIEPTLAEYLKLLQFEQEVAQEDETPSEIKVTWVEPEADCSEE